MFIMMTFWWSVYNDDFPFTTSKTKRDNRVIYAGCLTSCRTTKDLRLYEIRKYQENLKTPKNYCPAPSRNPLAPNENQSPPPIFREWLWLPGCQENKSLKKLHFSENTILSWNILYENDVAKLVADSARCHSLCCFLPTSELVETRFFLFLNTFYHRFMT